MALYVLVRIWMLPVAEAKAENANVDFDGFRWRSSCVGIYDGAQVEGANMGFQVLCEGLLRSTNPEVYQLPKQWIDVFLFILLRH